MGAAQSAMRLITRHKVSLTFEMPAYYREKIRAIPGVAQVVPENWFGGNYKDANKSQNFFAQFGTDPEEFFQVYPEWKIPPDQLEAWQKDRAGAIVDPDLAKKYGWKVGDHIIIQGATFPVDLELTIRGIYNPDAATNSLYYNQKYVEEAVAYLKRGKLRLTSAFWRSLPRTFRRSRARSTRCSATLHSPPRRRRKKPSSWALFPCWATRKGVHSQHLFWRGRVCHSAGLRQHHGHVHPRAHPRSGGAQDLGLHPPHHPVALRRRSGDPIARRRHSRLACRLWSRRPGGSRSRRLFRRRLESAPGNDDGGLGRGGAGRFPKRHRAFLQRFAHLALWMVCATLVERL